MKKFALIPLSLSLSMSLGLVSALLAGAAFATHDSPEEIEYRVKKVGRLNIVEAQAPAAAGATFNAEATYTAKCTACHSTGVMAAPVVGNADQWSARIAKGNDTLYNSAINGINGMPPKGGAMDLSDEQIKQIVDYMVSKSL